MDMTEDLQLQIEGLREENETEKKVREMIKKSKQENNIKKENNTKN